ncbi:MAG: AMP-binding protein [Pseudomonadota bacterium]
MRMPLQNVDLLGSFRRHRAERGDDLYLIDHGTRSYTWRESVDAIEAIAKSLTTLLNGKGERVAILSDNCAEWILADWGIMLSGHVSSPLFTTMMAEKLAYVVDRLEVKLLFLGNTANWEAVEAVLPDDITIVSLPHIETAPSTMSFADFISLGEAQALSQSPDPDALCSLILTSGTTGYPKAVMHSQRSLLNVAQSFMQLTGQEHLDEIRLFCHLPLGHIGEKTVSVVQSVLTGASITFSRGPEYFIEDLRCARPTLMLAVPRIWERLLAVAQDRFRISGDDAETGSDPQQSNDLGAEVREYLGLDKVACFISGGAICPPYVKREFRRFGIDISDFYGQTEILPLTYQDGGATVPDSVGTAAPGFDIVIGPDGEILGRGPGMALGYFKDEAKSAQTFKNGWVHTGDKGRIDDNGYLFITGRVSEEFKTAKGKFVAPGPIEKRYSEIELVEQCALVGLGLTQPLILCTLSEAALGLAEDAIERQLLADTASLNRDLEPHERIGAILICRTSWTVEEGLLTHTQKIIRAKLAERFSADISQFATELSAGSRGFARWH